MYLNCGVATCISIKKDRYSTEEILEDLKLNMNLDIFDIQDEEKYLYLNIKEDIFEDNIIDFIKSQITIAGNTDLERDFEFLEGFEGKTLDEMIEYSKNYNRMPFYHSRGYFSISNDISYIFTNIQCNATADMVIYISEGKIIMECWFSIFKYLREKLVNATDNVLKDALFLTIG